MLIFARWICIPINRGLLSCALQNQERQKTKTYMYLLRKIYRFWKSYAFYLILAWMWWKLRFKSIFNRNPQFPSRSLCRRDCFLALDSANALLILTGLELPTAHWGNPHHSTIRVVVKNHFVWYQIWPYYLFPTTF